MTSKFSFDNFRKLYFGGLMIFTTILMIILPVDMRVKTFSYDTLYFLTGILLFCLGLLYLSGHIARLLASNRQIQKWYIKYKEKEWRENK